MVSTLCYNGHLFSQMFKINITETTYNYFGRTAITTVFKDLSNPHHGSQLIPSFIPPGIDAAL